MAKGHASDWSMNRYFIARVTEVAQRDVYQGRRRGKVAQFFDANEHRCALCGFSFPRHHSHEERRWHEKNEPHVSNHAHYLRMHDEFAMEAHERRQREIARVAMERKRAAVDETIREHGADAWVSYFDDRFKAVLFEEMRRVYEPNVRVVRVEAADAFLQLKRRVRISMLARAALGVFGEDGGDQAFLLARLVAPSLGGEGMACMH